MSCCQSCMPICKNEYALQMLYSTLHSVENSLCRDAKVRKCGLQRMLTEVWNGQLKAHCFFMQTVKTDQTCAG